MEGVIFLIIKVLTWIGFIIYLLCIWYYEFMKAQLKTEALINLATDEPKRRRRKK
ncbi:MAG: hypothetical protein MJ250_03025 [Alphaproteobacteria bacterium]|nr:hypothetical protein [Alphaproteobacteria bacterium]